MKPADAVLFVEGYAELAYNPRNNLLEVCAERLKKTYLEASRVLCVGGITSNVQQAAADVAFECNRMPLQCRSWHARLELPTALAS